jgi:hypothetical protein
MDSTGLLETTVAGIPFPPVVPEAVYNENLSYEISIHLQGLQDGIFPLGTPIREAIRLTDGGYRYASISPIVGTAWSIVVLSNGEDGLTMRYLPLILTTLLSIIGFVLLGGLFVRRVITVPLNKLAQSTARIGANFDI